MLTADIEAPDWGHDLARRVEAYVQSELAQPVAVPSYVVADFQQQNMGLEPSLWATT